MKSHPLLRMNFQIDFMGYKGPNGDVTSFFPQQEGNWKMKPARISLPEKLFPIQVALSAVPDDWFPEVMISFFSGVGFGFNDSGIAFPDIDPDNDIPEGFVEFYVLSDGVQIPYEEAKEYARSAILEHLKSHPHDRDRLEQYVR